MRLPVVTRDNLAYCDGLRQGLTERRLSMHREVLRYPLELTINSEHLQYRVVMTTPEEVDALVFGLTLLVNTVRDTPPPKTGMLDFFRRTP